MILTLPIQRTKKNKLCGKSATADFLNAGGFAILISRENARKSLTGR